MALEKVLLAKPRGFCAGVVRAVDIVNIALDVYEKPLYVRKEIVHNRHVVEELRAKGTVFVDTLLEVPSGATVVFSAHGVSPEVREKAKAKNLKVIDATCPLVTKVHLEAVKYAREGYTIVLIGHKGHEEVVGTMGEAPQHMVLISSREEVEQLQPPDSNRIAYLTQTTLSLDETREIIAALRERFPTSWVLRPKTFAMQRRTARNRFKPWRGTQVSFSLSALPTARTPIGWWRKPRNRARNPT
jgi:4-hydroxy-3-methylbut-2-enyl diphosphate reductase